MTTELGVKIEADLIATLDEWHSLNETWDNALDAQIHRWYADVKGVFPKRPYFSPSSANSCPRELYMKAKGAKKDDFTKPPYQGRWQRIGTSIGDMIQRDLLFIEKHFEAKTGNKPRFRFERDEQGRPAFEDFAKKNKLVTHRGHAFNLFGTPDGIMRYTTDDGEEIRVGLEVKSKQTTAAQTSLYSMREPKADHKRQVIAYSEMYDVDHYVILYVNAAKKGWAISDDDYEKVPDIRAFHVEVTEADRLALFDKFADVLDAIKSGQPPALDLFQWNFNNFKTACAVDLSEEELAEVKQQVKRMMKSSLPDWKKQGHLDAWDFIQDAREGEAG